MRPAATSAARVVVSVELRVRQSLRSSAMVSGAAAALRCCSIFCSVVSGDAGAVAAIGAQLEDEVNEKPIQPHLFDQLIMDANEIHK